MTRTIDNLRCPECGAVFGQGDRALLWPDTAGALRLWHDACLRAWLRRFDLYDDDPPGEAVTAAAAETYPPAEFVQC